MNVVVRNYRIEWVAKSEGLGEAFGEGRVMLVKESVEPMAHEGGEGIASVVAAGADELAELTVAGVATFGFGVEMFLEAKGNGGVEIIGGFLADFVRDNPGHEGGVGGDARPVGRQKWKRRQRRS